MPEDLKFDANQAISRLMQFLAVEGVTGEEEAIGRTIVRSLMAAGVPRSAIRFDSAHRRIPVPTQTGNLIVQLPGTRPGPRRMFMTHMDTVPTCAGAKPVRKGERIVAAGPTALGGDNRTGCATLVTLAATLLQRRIPHPPLTFFFSVREESGLWGARFVDPRDLGRPVEAFNVDGGSASEMINGAVGAQRWQVEITGRASHAGVWPERGISATLVGSLALAEVARGGWFGKVRKGGKKGTSNIGTFGGRDGKGAGDATNVVTDYAFLRGESRSHDLPFARAITAAYRTAFANAGKRVRDHQGRCAKIRFTAQDDYFPFLVPEKNPTVRRALAAVAAAGLSPSIRQSNGGLDANWMVKHGIPTVTFGAGQNNIHAIGEWVDLGQFRKACAVALALAQQA